MCLEEKQHIPILVSYLTRQGLKPTFYHTQDEQANHNTTDVVTKLWLTSPKYDSLYQSIYQSMINFTNVRLPAPKYDYLQQSMITCTKVWLPAAKYDYLQQSMINFTKVWLNLPKYD